MNESSISREKQSSGGIGILTVKGEIPWGLRFYWEDTTGEHSIAEATTKQARDWAHKLAKRISASDFFLSIATAIDEIPTADKITRLEALKEFRKDVNIWFGQFCPPERQWRIVLVTIKELSDRLIWLLAKYFERKAMDEITIFWEVEPLPGDGGIYQIILKGGRKEGDTGVYYN